MSKKHLALWLNKVADELDRRFGPHPKVPRSEVQKIAREMVMQSDVRNKTDLCRDLDARIQKAFKGTDLDY